MTSVAISRQLADSYANAIYRIDAAPDPVFLRIGQFSQPLAALLHASGQNHAAIISAYNPFSEVISHEENEATHQSLYRLLQQQGHSFIEGMNIDPSMQWPDEKSFLIYGIDSDTAQSIGRQYRQNAIVWIDAIATPRLLWLR